MKVISFVFVHERRRRQRRRRFVCLIFIYISLQQSVHDANNEGRKKKRRIEKEVDKHKNVYTSLTSEKIRVVAVIYKISLAD